MTFRRDGLPPREDDRSPAGDLFRLIPRVRVASILLDLIGSTSSDDI